MNCGRRRSYSRVEMVRLTDRTFHVYNRGVDRQVIYRSDQFYKRFLELMDQYVKPADLLILAFCLMPNHFHLLIKQLRAFGISALMESTCGDYAKLVNHSLNRSGHLFENTYQMKVAREDDSCLQLARYIHLNPWKAGLVTNPRDWPYSSCNAYSGHPAPLFLNCESLLSHLDRDHLHHSALTQPDGNDPDIPRHLSFRE